MMQPGIDRNLRPDDALDVKAAKRCRVGVTTSLRLVPIYFLTIVVVNGPLAINATTVSPRPPS